MSMMVSFVLLFFPRGVLDEILNLIESVSEGFPSYFFILGVFTENPLSKSLELNVYIPITISSHATFVTSK